MLQVTPTQAKAAERHKSLQAAITRRASLVCAREDRSYSIPNTPFGVPKIPEPTVVERLRYVAPAYSYCWCYDLIRFAERYKPTAYVPHKLQIRDIQETVAEYYGVRVADILSARRSASIVRPRQIAVFLSKILTGKSLPEIGQRFGGRDHTTILWAVRKITLLMETEAGLRSELDGLAASLGGRLA